MATIAYVKGYFGEKGKQHVNTSGQLNQVNVQGEKTYQTTEGDQSPVINAKGDVTVIFQGLPKKEREALIKQGDSQQLIDRLLKELDAKDEELVRCEAEVKKWAKKFDEVMNMIAKRPEDDKQAIKAKEALIEGDLEKAKSVVTLSGVSSSGVSFH